MTTPTPQARVTDTVDPFVGHPACQKRGCTAPATQHVLVAQFGGFDEAFACDAHAMPDNVMMIGQLVMPNADLTGKQKPEKEVTNV